MCILGGCSVSPTVDAASWTVGGISYLLTGKSAVDHAVSAAAGQDCAMTRMVKNGRVCVPLDEDVAGDRLVFEFDGSSRTGGSTDQVADGDPLRVNPAIADIVEPLGELVMVEARSSAVAAVAADAMPIHAVTGGQEEGSWIPGFSALSKGKAEMPMTSPDLATRLWLPVE
jgi:hypothetical protein